MAAESRLADVPAITQVLCLETCTTPGQGIGVLVINYNTARQTLRCLESLQQSSVLPDWVLVLDNASSSSDYQYLRDGAKAPKAGTLSIYRSEQNLGFAQGSNVLIDLLLQQSGCQYIMLLNNDAVAEKEMLSALRTVLLEAGDKAGLAGGRMHKLGDPTRVDTLGIALYASLMPADRQTLDDIYVGPTGGCCMLTRALLERLKAVSGYYFDSRFFCYCEDTDLVIRAVLLGYRRLYLDQRLALHEGQASSGGGYNPFIAYHGLRNTLWMHVKLMPARMLWRHGPLLLLAHVSMMARHALAGRFTLMLKVYRDAFRKFPEFIAERKSLQLHFENHRNDLQAYITPRFYRKGYAGSILRKNSVFKYFF